MELNTGNKKCLLSTYLSEQDITQYNIECRMCDCVDEDKCIQKCPCLVVRYNKNDITDTLVIVPMYECTLEEARTLVHSSITDCVLEYNEGYSNPFYYTVYLEPSVEIKFDEARKYSYNKNRMIYYAGEE